MKINKSLRDKFSQKHNPQGTRGVLASIFTEMMMGKVKDITTWNALMTRFIDDPINAVPPGKKDRSSARGNLSKELTKNHLSWNVFCNKAMRFLNLVAFKITITAYHQKGIETVHERTIHLQMPVNQEERTEMEKFNKEIENITKQPAAPLEEVEFVVTNAPLKPFTLNVYSDQAQAEPLTASAPAERMYA